MAERGGEREREESGDANDKFVCSDRSKPCMYIQSYAKVWAPLIISITFIYKMLGVWMRNVFVIYIHIRHGQ